MRLNFGAASCHLPSRNHSSIRILVRSRSDWFFSLYEVGSAAGVASPPSGGVVGSTLLSVAEVYGPSSLRMDAAGRIHAIQ